jgi:hypothetical protein
VKRKRKTNEIYGIYNINGKTENDRFSTFTVTQVNVAMYQISRVGIP